ncbi:MAG: transporter substrate-binding domain-containing protein [Acetivibrio sp.]
MKKIAAIFTIGTMILLAGCKSNIPPNQVFSAEDLGGKTIGVQLGTTGDIIAGDYEAEGSKVERYSKGNDAIQSLKQGKIDCVLIDEQPAKAFAAKNEDLKILKGGFDPEEYAICISKEKMDLKEKINAALAELKTEGIVDAIISNYIGDDTKGKTPYTSPENVERTNGTLIMATNATFEPYEYYADQKVVGIDADLAQAVADKLGMDLKIEDMEFDAIINAVQSGKADIGIAGMTVTEDRLISIDFTDTYATSQQVILVRKK